MGHTLFCVLSLFSARVSVTLQPNWNQIFRGESVTLTCEIQGGGDTEVHYEWTRNNHNTHGNQKEFMIIRATESHSGNYRCRGSRNSFFTQWSDAVTLTVAYKPRPVLSVSPSWLSPGASVTLNCELEHPSAGWRFYWYKAVPDLSHKSYRYELLPARDTGTGHNSYVLHGQTHTAGHVCRAGRGDPVYYTDHSEPQFVWSGASLTVNPDRVQHFTSDSVSLSCEGNSTEWTVRRFPEDVPLSPCSHWGTMTGSTCKISTSRSGTAVYWCESGSGEFSNSVNITVHNADILLVSPVHPVTEGQSVTVGCKFRNTNFVSNVIFYQNDKLRQNDTRQELNISAVSKSDEGFYKCQCSGKESPQSWLTVTGPETSFTVPFVTGLVIRMLLIVFLLLLLLLIIQSLIISQDSATQQTVDHSQTQIYSSLLHDDVSVYESIRGSGNTGNGRRDDPEENSDYNNVNPDSTTGTNIVTTLTNNNNEIRFTVKMSRTGRGRRKPAEAMRRFEQTDPGTRRH
ncbi:hypothetical protein Q5P01_000853 [Channa striata]|uniref:Ig-like domain-containing protein n=1 Tax=Channa striata TaxID=64152 RepID=A0AA88IRE1_CHASR|nr:hypothetical protein Q5P01_000853 [Channa striata]